MALPWWGCGNQDCEAGLIWRTGAACEICAEVVQDKAAARRREQRAAQGLCSEHGTRPGPSGRCGTCEPDARVARPAPVVVQQRVPDGTPRGDCGDCGARIVLTGRALEDGLCKLCREEAADQAPPASGVNAERICSGRDGHAPRGRTPLPSRSVCARHRAQELAGAVA
ncbi:hypothetical protein ACH4GP_19065 [Streptomyces celluloflavus]|uniref:DksA C4-type domain-containing protein n=1 Tax=Streptomyces celluloflavus TaxID=58344 RepID=A0ABW7RJH1_9ACTN